jgi:hypothetical protein
MLEGIDDGLLFLSHRLSRFGGLGLRAREARVLGRLVLFQATDLIFASTAAGAGIVASRFSHGEVGGRPGKNFNKKGPLPCTDPALSA